MPDCIEWVQNDLLELLEEAPKASLNIYIHVTQDEAAVKGDADTEKNFSHALAPTFGRADLPAIIRKATDENKSVGMAGRPKALDEYKTCPLTHFRLFRSLRPVIHGL